MTLTQSVEPQALLIGLVSPKQILRVWHRAKRSDAGRWYTRSEFLALGLEAGPSANEPQGIKKKVEDLGIDLSSPRLSLDEFLDATARLADVPRSRVESALSVRAPKGEDEIVRLIERFGFQPKAAQAFARKFMKSLTNKQVAAALLNAANILSASGKGTTWFHGGSADDVQQVKALGHFPAEYAPRQDNWGAGVYLTSSKKEAKQFGDAVIGVNVAPSVKLLDMRDPTYRAMPTTVFDKLQSAKAKAAFQKHWDKGNIGESVRAGVLADGYDGIVWKGDDWNDWAVVFDPTQVHWRRKTSGSPVQASSQIARKDNGRPRGTFIGSADGWEYTEGYPLGLRGGWAASIGLSSSNNWMNLSVEGATEYDENFRNALKEIVAEYPEVEGYVVSFDGPDVPVSELLTMESKDFRDIVFLHGTSSAVLPRIMAEGLRPRGETGVDPAYGYASSAKPGLPDRVYLTTQPAMANFAARSAARVHGGEPVVLEITGLDPSYALPDEDSRAKTAEESLARLGSIAYSRTIPTSKIRAVQGKVKAS